MRKKKICVVCMAAIVGASMMMGMTASAQENTIAIPHDQESAWEELAVTNDDTVSTGINIRSAADENSDVIGYLYHGGAAWVLNRGEEWTEIYSGGITGFVKNEYLTYGEDAKNMAQNHGTEGVATTWDDVKVYADDDGASEVITSLDSGSSMILTQDNGHWIEVQRGADSTAYVSSEDVSRVLLLDTAVSTDAVNQDAAQTYYEESYADDTYTQEDSYTDSTSSGEAWTDDSSAGETWTDDSSAGETWTDDSSASETWTDDSSSGETWTEDSSTEETYAEETYTEEYVEQTDAADSGRVPTADDGSYYEPATGIYYDANTGLYYDSGTGTLYDAYWNPVYEGTAVTPETSAPETSAPETSTPETSAPETESSGSSAGTDDTNLLAALIYCEAGNQSYEGMVAVGAVVMNRVASASFPNTISDVIYQGGQFTPASSGALSSALANGVPSTCYDAAVAALNGENPVGGALYFNTGSGKGMKIGDHQFY